MNRFGGGIGKMGHGASPSPCRNQLQSCIGIAGGRERGAVSVHG